MNSGPHSAGCRRRHRHPSGALPTSTRSAGRRGAPRPLHPCLPEATMQAGSRPARTRHDLLRNSGHRAVHCVARRYDPRPTTVAQLLRNVAFVRTGAAAPGSQEPVRPSRPSSNRCPDRPDPTRGDPSKTHHRIFGARLNGALKISYIDADRDPAPPPDGTQIRRKVRMGPPLPLRRSRLRRRHKQPPESTKGRNHLLSSSQSEEGACHPGPSPFPSSHETGSHPRTHPTTYAYPTLPPRPPKPPTKTDRMSNKKSPRNPRQTT